MASDDGWVIVGSPASPSRSPKSIAASRPPTGSAAMIRVRRQKRQAEACVDEVAWRDVHVGEVGHPGLQSGAEVSGRGGFEGTDRSRLAVNSEDAPPGPEQFARIAPSPAAEVDREPAGGRAGFGGEPPDRHPDRLPGRPVDRDFVVAGPVLGVDHRPSVAGSRRQARHRTRGTSSRPSVRPGVTRSLDVIPSKENTRLTAPQRLVESGDPLVTTRPRLRWVA